jgi:Ricin-type beta-trefoil lectin domain-like
MQPDLTFIRRAPTLLIGLVAAMLFCAPSASAQSPEVPEVGVEYRIKARHSEQALDVLGGSHSAGANVGTWKQLEDPSKQQRWKLIDVPGNPGHFYLAVTHSGALLDVLGGAKNQGANVGVWKNEPDGLANQIWTLEPSDEGFFRIKNDDSGLYLDVLGAATAIGSNVGQWPWHSGYQQQWGFFRVEPVSPANVLTRGTITTMGSWINSCSPGGKCTVTVGDQFTISSGLVSAWSSELETSLSSTLSSSTTVGAETTSPVGGVKAETTVSASVTAGLRAAINRSKSTSSDRQSQNSSGLACEYNAPADKFGYFYEVVSKIGDESATVRTCHFACGTVTPTFSVESQEHLSSCQ